MRPKEYCLDDFDELFGWLEENRQAINSVIRIPKPERLKKDMRWVGDVLRTLGMKQRQWQKKLNVYHLDLERLAHIQEWFERHEPPPVLESQERI